MLLSTHEFKKYKNQPVTLTFFKPIKQEKGNLMQSQTVMMAQRWKDEQIARLDIMCILFFIFFCYHFSYFLFFFVVASNYVFLF